MSTDKRGYRQQVRIIVVKNNEILLGKKYKEGKFKNYTFPGGGVDEGETPEQSVIKECLEETGIAVDKVLFLNITMRYEGLSNPERAKIYRGGEDNWYICKFKNYDKRLFGSQNDSLAFSWETVDKAIELIEKSDEFSFNSLHLDILRKVKSHPYISKSHSEQSFVKW